jgi:hypothetical protein
MGLLLAVFLVTTACGSNHGKVTSAGSHTSTSTGTTAPSGGTVPTSSDQSRAPAIVGRWHQVHTCDELVAALKQNGLESLAPGVAGDFFPGLTPQQLAQKPDLCRGARPQEHSHFFNASGGFGSLDQDGRQVDDGNYTIVNNHILRIGEDATFAYRVSGSNLILHPIISNATRRAALARTLDFTTAGWQVAVSYDGLPWKGVPCAGWC